MRMLWSVIKWALLVAVVSGCQAKRETWPAKMISLNGFNQTNGQVVVDSLRRMNAKSNKTYVLVDSENAPNAWPMTIEQHDTWTNEPTTAGITYRDEESCRIALSTELFKSIREEYVDSVIWHEVGHCAGLNHVPQEGAIMFATARPFRLFKAAAIDDFFGELRNVLWSEPLAK